MQMTDLGHGRGWLSEGPAASIRRIDLQIGHPLQTTETGRTWAQQKAHWDTYQRYGKPIALHPDTPSIHQKGAAIDSDEAQRILGVMAENGWKQTVYRTINGRRTLVEPWHFEYDPDADRRRNDPQPSNPHQSEEDDMPEPKPIIFEIDPKPKNGVAVVADLVKQTYFKVRNAHQKAFYINTGRAEPLNNVQSAAVLEGFTETNA